MTASSLPICPMCFKPHDHHIRLAMMCLKLTKKDIFRCFWLLLLHMVNMLHILHKLLTLYMLHRLLTIIFSMKW